LSANFRGKGDHPPTNFGVRKLESLGYHVVLFALLLAVLIQYRRVTHRHTHTRDDGYYPRRASSARVISRPLLQL